MYRQRPPAKLEARKTGKAKGGKGRRFPPKRTLNLIQERTALPHAVVDLGCGLLGRIFCLRVLDLAGNRAQVVRAAFTFGDALLDGLADVHFCSPPVVNRCTFLYLSIKDQQPSIPVNFSQKF